MNHLHFLIWAAEKKTAEGQFTGVTYVDVEAASATEALKRAKEICKDLKKSVYWIQNATEVHEGHEK
jgi:hypothetical protein